MKKLFLVFVAVCGLLTVGCSEPSDSTSSPGGDIQITFINLTADGSGTATTTKLIFTFSQDIAGLTAADITLTPALTKGTLTRVSAGVYELSVSGITASGQVTVSVSKSGFTFSLTSLNVTVNYSGIGGGECPDCSEEPCICDAGECLDCNEEPCICDAGECSDCGEEPCICDAGECLDCSEEPCICDVGECSDCGDDPCTCIDGNGIGIGVGDPSIKIFKDSLLLQGDSTQIVQGSGTYTLSVDSDVTFTEIIWHLNGNEVARNKTSIIMSSQIVGTYIVTVEAIPQGGIKDSGSHIFVVQ